MNASYWVALYDDGHTQTIKIHHGIKPAIPLAGPYGTYAGAVAAKAAIFAGKVFRAPFERNRRGPKVQKEERKDPRVRGSQKKNIIK